MVFSKSIKVFCLLLLLALQCMMAQHASVHPVEFEMGSDVHHSEYSDHGGHSHQSDDDGHCGFCDVIKTAAHVLDDPYPVAIFLLSLALIAYALTTPALRVPRRRATSHYPQGPPAFLS